jgi:hypothetical protein
LVVINPGKNRIVRRFFVSVLSNTDKYTIKMSKFRDWVHTFINGAS